MTTIPIYQALADAFLAEGMDAQFTLMGDGNMHWSTVLKNDPRVKTYYVRHEHNALTMAMGYHGATGKVGVASITCGPGVTQIPTALTAAVRNGVPMVVFAGETPLGSRYHNQHIEQQPLIAACGAHYIPAHVPAKMHQYVRDAFHFARSERKPAVIGIPYDLQPQPMPAIGPYRPSTDAMPALDPIAPDAAKTAKIVELLLAAKRPAVLAGRGVMAAGATAAVEDVAERFGALLATSLLARGLYDHNPFSLGHSGGYARQVAKEELAKSDLIVAFGASLNTFTLDNGRMFPQATVVHVDVEPSGMRQSLRNADIHLRADARLAAEAMLAIAGNRPVAATVRTEELARRIRDLPPDPTHFEVEDGLLDPRKVFATLQDVIPHDFDAVSGAGHQGYFHTHMRGTHPSRYHCYRNFGAIGNSFGIALGVAAARGDGRVVLFEGDGGLIMHIQELETARRHGIKMLIVCANDGGYGAEIHVLRGQGMDPSGAIYGRVDFPAIARGFGLGGATVTDVGQFKDLMADYEKGPDLAIWNVHMSDRVTSPTRRSGSAH